jgi:hypothetical protein
MRTAQSSHSSDGPHAGRVIDAVRKFLAASERVSLESYRGARSTS